MWQDRPTNASFNASMTVVLSDSLAILTIGGIVMKSIPQFLLYNDVALTPKLIVMTKIMTE